MNKKIIYLIVAGILIIGAVGFFMVDLNKSDDNGNEKKINNAVATSLGLQEKIIGDTGSGDVAVGLTPLGFKDGNLVMEISANTHSVDLSEFDLKKLITLEYEGNVINPVSAPQLNGHHSYGELIFDVGNEITGYSIKITGIPKVEERVFEWN